MKTSKFRAVFSSPTPNRQGQGSFGPERDSLGDALKDRPERVEETGEFLSGVEIREVTPWTKVPLEELINFSNTKTEKNLV